ncbi:hypothetical protein DdX_22449 [Ditylenchus destructor]|uniref:Uncharacterized protein n=1 Tax=Ditylenchus destructor TaxID=166010 RepID=A0AAD4MDK0_9BILA|nr:hypothetical protein DdX_22449 [Ditylenchus destructor]
MRCPFSTAISSQAENQTSPPASRATSHRARSANRRTGRAGDRGGRCEGGRGSRFSVTPASVPGSTVRQEPHGHGSAAPWPRNKPG